MKPEKEKATELKDKFQSVSGNNEYAKAYAIICCEEIMQIIGTMIIKCVWESAKCHLDLRFWRKVKKEIQLMKAIIFLILLFLSSCLTVPAQVYIDPQYTGVKNGTIAQPFNSWSDLTWKAGNTYLFKRGSTYNTSTELRATASNIKIGAYGIGDRPIIKSSINKGKILDFGSLSNVVVSDLDVISTNNAQSCFHFITGGRASIINCKIHGSEWGVRNINSKGLFRIVNCEIYMTGDDGSYNEKLDSIEVSGTYIHDVNQKWFVNQSETYSGGDALQLNNVKYFNIYNNNLDHSGTGNKFCFISENSNSGLISSGVILNNTFKRSDNGNCIYLYQDQQNVLVKGNKFTNAGIAIYNHSLNLRVYYNEFTNISNLAFQGLGASSSNTRIINNLISCYNEVVTFQNNIVYKCYGKTFSSGSNLKSDYNCYYQNTNLGITNTGTNSIKADPLLNDPANLDLKLKKGSPCIDKASNILRADSERFNVPYNNLSDIGAWEYKNTEIQDSIEYYNAKIADLNSQISKLIELYAAQKAAYDAVKPIVDILLLNEKIAEQKTMLKECYNIFLKSSISNSLKLEIRTKLLPYIQ